MSCLLSDWATRLLWVWIWLSVSLSLCLFLNHDSGASFNEEAQELTFSTKHNDLHRSSAQSFANAHPAVEPQLCHPTAGVPGQAAALPQRVNLLNRYHGVKIKRFLVASYLLVRCEIEDKLSHVLFCATGDLNSTPKAWAHVWLVLIEYNYLSRQENTYWCIDSIIPVACKDNQNSNFL